jgi:hypothetical protein
MPLQMQFRVLSCLHKYKYLFMLHRIALIALTLFLPLVAQDNCVSCHTPHLEKCKVSCQSCHSGSGSIAEPGHQNLIANPSSPALWQEKCGQCHAAIVLGTQKDGHFTNQNIIGQTRFLWGKTRRLERTAVAMQTLNATITDDADIADLVDHFLRKKCLSCHVQTAGHQVKGMFRSDGCASCHGVRNQQTGEADANHFFTGNIPDSQCLTCHNGNSVGGDYHGYYEMDYHESYQTPYGSEPVFGAWQHRLALDVHQQAGMQCVDCHNLHEQKTKTCADCHGNGQKPVSNETDMPVFSRDIVAHEAFHDRLECASCHAQWSYQDYGFHLMLDMHKSGYANWRKLKWQGDPEITRLLERELALEKALRSHPVTLDWVDGKMTRGAWYKGFTLRRWENPPLAVNAQNRIQVARPQKQYVVTYINTKNEVIHDSVVPKRADGTPGQGFQTYAPHTIGVSRSCESCHGNPKAMGKGIFLSGNVTLSHPDTRLGQPVIPGERLLNAAEISRMGKTGKRYKTERARAFQQEGWWHWIEDK